MSDLIEFDEELKSGGKLANRALCHIKTSHSREAELQQRLTVADEKLDLARLEIKRTERNRDMWKSQVGRQAKKLAALRKNADRYQWLRERDLNSIHDGGVFAGQTPRNVVMNGEDLDNAIDVALKLTTEGGSNE